MSELTLFVLRIAFLIALWVFVFFVIFALRSDLFGQRVRRLNSSGSSSGSGERSAVSNQGVPAAASAFLTSAQPTVTPSESSRTRQGVTSATGALRLVITSGELAGQELSLTDHDVTIGRSSESTLVIQDDYTSTHHAALELKGGSWMLTDLGSTNGTFLDGVRVTHSVPLPLDTPITVGSVTFEIRR